MSHGDGSKAARWRSTRLDCGEKRGLRRTFCPSFFVFSLIADIFLFTIIFLCCLLLYVRFFDIFLHNLFFFPFFPPSPPTHLCSLLQITCPTECDDASCALALPSSAFFLAFSWRPRQAMATRNSGAPCLPCYRFFFRT